MMENHKILPVKDINKEIFSILGMDITVFEFIDYAEKDIFTIKKVINSWENMGNGSKTTTKNEVIG